MARRVETPDGARWTVARRWSAPEADGRGRRVTQRDWGRIRGHGFWPTPHRVDPVSHSRATYLLIVVLAPIVALCAAVPFIVVHFAAGPVALAALIAVLFAAVVTFGARRTWAIVAAPESGGAAYAWRVRGWRASGETADEVAGALRAGSLPAGATTGGGGGTAIPPGA